MKGYLTVKEVAENWGLSIRRIETMCINGQLEGVTKFGKSWVIPERAERPRDRRVTTGQYCNARRKTAV